MKLDMRSFTDDGTRITLAPMCLGSLGRTVGASTVEDFPFGLVDRHRDRNDGRPDFLH